MQSTTPFIPSSIEEAREMMAFISDQTQFLSPKKCVECGHEKLYRQDDGFEIRVDPQSRSHPVCRRCKFCHRRAITDGTGLHFVLPHGHHSRCTDWPEASNSYINIRFYTVDSDGLARNVF